MPSAIGELGHAQFERCISIWSPISFVDEAEKEGRITDDLTIEYDGPVSVEDFVDQLVDRTTSYDEVADDIIIDMVQDLEVREVRREKQVPRTPLASLTTRLRPPRPSGRRGHASDASKRAYRMRLGRLEINSLLVITNGSGCQASFLIFQVSLRFKDIRLFARQVHALPPANPISNNLTIGLQFAKLAADCGF